MGRLTRECERIRMLFQNTIVRLTITLIKGILPATLSDCFANESRRRIERGPSTRCLLSNRPFSRAFPRRERDRGVRMYSGTFAYFHRASSIERKTRARREERRARTRRARRARTVTFIFVGHKIVTEHLQGSTSLAEEGKTPQSPTV